MNPLRVSTYTAVLRGGRGPRRARCARCARESPGSASVAFDTNHLDCWLGEVQRFRRSAHGRAGGMGLPQQSPGGVRARAGPVPRFGRRLPRTVRRRAASACSSAPALPACSTPSLRIARATRRATRCPRGSTSGARRISSRWRHSPRCASGSPARRLRSPPPAHRAPRCFAAAQPRHRVGRMRRRRGRRSRQPVPHYSLWLQLPAAHLRRYLPARGQRAHGNLDRRSRRIRVARSAGRRVRWRCSATARPAMPITCPRPSPAAGAPSNPCARRWRAPASRLTKSTTSTCMAPARSPTTTPRAAPCARSSAPRRRAVRRKGWTGHTLGAAGIVEAAISLMAIEHGLMPRSLNTRVRDPAIEAGILLENREAPVRRVLSNSFGFGGSNCSLLFGSVQ